MSQTVGVDALADATLRSQTREQVANVGRVDASTVKGAEHRRATVDASLPGTSSQCAVRAAVPASISLQSGVLVRSGPDGIDGCYVVGVAEMLGDAEAVLERPQDAVVVVLGVVDARHGERTDDRTDDVAA
jgi:hypothetical protein